MFLLRHNEELFYSTLSALPKTGIDEDVSWRCLKEAVIAIQESRKLEDNVTQETLYRYVDNLITQRPPAHLYADLRGNFIV